MTVWRYTAVPRVADGRAKRSGELAGDDAADVRASLRRIGLQVIDLRPVKPAVDGPSPRTWVQRATSGVRSALAQYLRLRRRLERAELYDGLATLLGSGLPLLEAVDSLIGSTGSTRRSPLRSMLVSVREALRSGSSLADAMAGHPSWFEPAELAMVRAAEHAGTLPDVLTALAERHQRSGELGHKLASALAYPAIVAVVGLGVVVFLSVKTLPDLTRILTDAGIEVPALTAKVMAFGGFLAGRWLSIALAAALVGVAAAVVWGWSVSQRIEPPRALRRLSPKLLRRMAVARMSLQLAELLRAGVPLVESLRVLAPAARGSLRHRLLDAAGRVEHGDELADALDDPHWFDTQFRRLLEIGQASGELDRLLDRIGRRYLRQADRLIDRMTALLEPGVILTLAALVGVVVMAAVLPLLRLQEVL